MKAIETKYKGYRFRSRLEARWAVFFDALGLDWQYEPEGYETSAGWYLPDFYIVCDKVTLGYVEIKPDRELEADERARILSLNEDRFVTVIYGQPWVDMDHRGFIIPEYRIEYNPIWSKYGRELTECIFSQCIRCKKINIETLATHSIHAKKNEVGYGCKMDCKSESPGNPTSDDLVNAYLAARGKRF